MVITENVDTVTYLRQIISMKDRMEKEINGRVALKLKQIPES